MKNFKIGFLKKYSRLISILLTLLGFSTACDQGTGEPDDNGGLICAYGSPSAHFLVHGNVKSESNSSVIPSIRVVMGYDTTYTDEFGNYEVMVRDSPSPQAYLLEFKDIDGSTNGDYQPLDTIVEFEDCQFTGGSGVWYQGETEKELNVDLKIKE